MNNYGGENQADHLEDKSSLRRYDAVDIDFAHFII
jgi:hypothetical protein